MFDKNYVPGIAKFMDMGDMAAMIAPRRLIIVNGDQDPIFSKHGVDKAYETVKRGYAAAGVPENCTLVTGHGEHQYYKYEAWNCFAKMTEGMFLCRFENPYSEHLQR